MKSLSMFATIALATMPACAPVLRVPPDRPPAVSVELSRVAVETTPTGTVYVVRAEIEEHGVAPVRLQSAQLILAGAGTTFDPIDRTADVQAVELATGGVSAFEWRIPQPPGVTAPTSILLNVSFAPAESPQVSTASGQADLPRPASAAQAVTLEGVVKDRSGNPVPGAQVEIVEQYDTAITDRMGRFSFDDLEPGTITVRTSKGGYVGDEQDATVSSDTKVDIVITAVDPQ